MTDSQHARTLAERREALIAQAQQQRLDLARASPPLMRRLAWVDDGLAIGRWARANPWWLAGAALALAVWRPARALRFAGLALALWRATGFLRSSGPR